MKHTVCVLGLLIVFVMLGAQTIQPRSSLDEYNLHVRLNKADGRAIIGPEVSIVDQDGKVSKPSPLCNINGFSSFSLGYGKFTLRYPGYRDHDIYVLPFLTNLVIMSEVTGSNTVPAANTYLELSDMIVHLLEPQDRKFYSWVYLQGETSKTESEICLINADRVDDLSTGLSFLAEINDFCAECNSFAYKRKLRLMGLDDPNMRSVAQIGNFSQSPILIKKIDQDTAELTIPGDKLSSGPVAIDVTLDTIMNEIIAGSIDAMYVTLVDSQPVIIYSTK